MITMQQLIYFQEIAVRGNLTQAAAELYVSQTTLSIMLKKLEEELGVRLFSRDGRKLQLNHAGRVYLEYVNTALKSLEDGKNVLSNLTKKSENTVVFSMHNSVLWSHIVRGFAKLHPDYVIRQQNYSADRFHSILESFQVDYVIAGLGDFPLGDLKYRVLLEESIYACMAKTHPLAGRSSIMIADLAEEPIVSLPPSSPFRLFCDSLFLKAGVPCRIAVECDYTLRKDLVSDGYGIALTTQSAYNTRFLGEDNAYVKISDAAKRKLTLVWNPQRVFSQAAVDFQQYLMESVVQSYS